MPKKMAVRKGETVAVKIRQAEFTKSGVLILEPEVQITFPPTLLRPLKDALERQILSYERNVGKIGGKGVADGKKR